jgi:quinolinate synthase
MYFTEQQLEQEAQRLFEKLNKVSWSMDECKLYAPLTLEINTLKKEQNAIILAHSYQTPDIMYGIADFVGDSYGLSLKATETQASKIICCTVHFMAETVKLLNPEAEVYIPKFAGCSLAESITIQDVWKLKEEHPNTPVACYVNTSAKIKSEVDVCVTSSNASKIINSIESDKVIFIPDRHMGANIQRETDKELILWNGGCIVHEKFTAEHIDQIRKIYPDVKVLAHPECLEDVVKKADFSGGTTAMIDYVKSSEADTFMVITECGLTDRLKIETEGNKFIGMCNLCPYMKEIEIKDVLQLLEEPKESQEVIIEKVYEKKARESLEMMMKLA